MVPNKNLNTKTNYLDECDIFYKKNTIWRKTT